MNSDPIIGLNTPVEHVAAAEKALGVSEHRPFEKPDPMVFTLTDPHVPLLGSDCTGLPRGGFAKRKRNHFRPNWEHQRTSPTQKKKKRRKR